MLYLLVDTAIRLIAAVSSSCYYRQSGLNLAINSRSSASFSLSSTAGSVIADDAPPPSSIGQNGILLYITIPIQSVIMFLPYSVLY